jgi:O-acetyl-ADP-ribose deacetylase (regulator of RNase III)
MNVVLVDLMQELCEAWSVAFAGTDNVKVHHSRFERLIGTFDCFVSPANSFGLMDGGIDLPIIQYFGIALQHRVQEEIWRVYRGEQPVGTCLIVPTNDPRCPWLAHCPTMGLPADVSKTSNAYAAFVAALTTAEAHGIQTLACPGLGTLTGRMPTGVAAAQMRYAYDVWSGEFTPARWTDMPERMSRSLGRS